MPQIRGREFRVVAPLSTHWKREATCEEVACPYFEQGFQIIVDESSVMGKRQKQLIEGSGKPFRKVHREESWFAYEFGPGVPCFRPHLARRSELDFNYLTDGKEQDPSDWHERFAETLEAEAKRRS